MLFRANQSKTVQFQVKNLPVAFAALRQTTFRGPSQLMDELLRIDAARHAAKAKPEGDS